MKMKNFRPVYPFEPFGRVDKLAEILKSNESTLHRLANAGERSYRRILIEKPGKDTREVWDAHTELKSIQARVQHLLLRKVEFPDYLHGGIRDVDSPRSYISSANVHSGAAWVLSEDIRQFFPSVSWELVFDVWRGLFKFPEHVASLLTDLTTVNRMLPQGAKTSTYIANLVLWRREPALVEKLSNEGLRYTRYIDDLTISGLDPATSEEIQLLSGKLVGMCSPLGLRLKRRKRYVARNSGPIKNLGLNVNERATLPKAKRSRIRTLVFRCEQLYEQSPGLSATVHYETEWNIASGRVGLLSQLHPNEGAALRVRLRRIRPSCSELAYSDVS